MVPNPAAADEADDGQSTHIDVPVLDDERGQVRNDLSDKRVDHGLVTVCTAGLQNLYGVGVNAFHCSREKLSEHSNNYDRYYQCTGLSIWCVPCLISSS